ncbi:uncharacterized protein LOC112052880 [Bicyclus anynana]|uniref:Uncharacterized protein LOC112052880 n=1 Tax=Bicyclus anynana TaxID=110368 RepID=A0ABM3LXT5_BICAN|nr:uncharacterized protein LOC112052880 [Bicyclus anynana]
MNNSEGKQVSNSVVPVNNSKTKPKIRTRKRKRHNSESSSDVDDLPDNTLETEKNLHISAKKNNLDEVSVKKILKKVVTNDHVLAFVKLREEEEGPGTEDVLQPKFTRAKAKELMKVSPRMPQWPIELTPIKHIPVKTRPEVTALIAQELPDDEDDDEYEPTHDESDEDHGLESCSDLDSQPRTPATPLSQKKRSPTVVKDGPFKVPQEVSVSVRKKLNLEEEATIALRTRSKLSLSETPIEHIESSFIPPDELPMPDVDDLWNDFLSECLNPESKTNEEDDELDPEYNVAADPDANDEDEALEKSIIKISKKELTDLVTELMNVMPEGLENQLPNATGDSQRTNGAADVGPNKVQNINEVQTHWEGKQEPLSDDEAETTNIASKITFESTNVVSRVSIGKTEVADVDENEAEQDQLNSTVVLKTESPTVVSSNMPAAVTRSVTISVEEREHPVLGGSEPALEPPAPLRHLVPPPPVKVNIEVTTPVQMSPDQVSILQQQLRQHVQLAATNFLQLFVHPVHWSYAHKYRGYLDSFKEIVSKNPKSVVDVCNLTPAIDLVNSWDLAVSANTKENKKMVEFIQAEVEKCHKRSTCNNYYVADFPELFKKVVANSTVFLYPYLLPPMPYRSFRTHRRYNYLKSEDELIVLGIDQFWQYIENNPELFKPPAKLHPRRRWGLMLTVRLVCKHMLPWISPKAMLNHIQCTRRTEDNRNPIVKYFTDKTIEPVKHAILPFNPKMTLYEHPEIEMPRLWIKYLAKNSKRFKHCPSRRYDAVQPPRGIEIKTGQVLGPTEKEALPIEFIKPIYSNRINVLPRTPKITFPDKVDVNIATTLSEVGSDNNFLVAANLFTVVDTGDGAKLMPLKLQTNTVNSSTEPICSPAVVDSNTHVQKNSEFADIVIKNNCIVITPKVIPPTKSLEKHCPCCELLRKICKLRQTHITDFFVSNRVKEKKCECRNKNYPNITNKLKMLVNCFKTQSNVLYTQLLQRLDKRYVGNDVKNESTDFNLEDFATAISYQCKVMARATVIRNINVKRAIQIAFSKFNTETGEPIKLAEKLFKIFDVDLADMYTEFLGFLTADQADSIGKFEEYFIRNCVRDLIQKIEAQVDDMVKRCSLLNQMKQMFSSKSTTACDICCGLLRDLEQYPELARHVFSLFPHRRQQHKSTTACDICCGLLRDLEQYPELQMCSSKSTTACDICCGLPRDLEQYPELARHVFSLFPHRRQQQQNVLGHKTHNIQEITSHGVTEENNSIGSSETSDKRTEVTQHSNTELRNKSPKVSDSVAKETLIVMDYEADNSCSEEELGIDMDEENEENEEETSADRREDERVQLVTRTAYEALDTPELTITKTEIQDHSETDMSMLIMSEDESIKTEPVDWTRDEDKLILEMLKQFLTPQERSDKTIVEIIKEKDLLNIITKKLTDKSLNDVTERVLYLLQILILSDYEKEK